MDYEIQTRGQSTKEFIELVLHADEDVIFIGGIEEEVARSTSDDSLDDDDPMPFGHRDISDNDPGPVRNHAPSN